MLQHFNFVPLSFFPTHNRQFIRLRKHQRKLPVLANEVLVPILVLLDHHVSVNAHIGHKLLILADYAFHEGSLRLGLKQI